MEKLKDYLFKIKYHKMDMLLISIFMIGIGSWLGATIEKYRTPDGQEPAIKLYSPLEQLPDPNRVVYVVYPWGAGHARYLKGEGKNKDMWLEHIFLHEDESTYDLVEMLGRLPIWWGYDYPVPLGLKEKLYKEAN